MEGITLYFLTFSRFSPTLFPSHSILFTIKSHPKWQVGGTGGLWVKHFWHLESPLGAANFTPPSHLGLHKPKTRGLDEVSANTAPDSPVGHDRIQSSGIPRGSLRTRSINKLEFLFLAVSWEKFLGEKSMNKSVAWTCVFIS